MICFFNRSVLFTLKSKTLLRKWIKDVITSYQHTVGAINFIFTDDSTLKDINVQYLSHDYYTDVITFDTSHYDEHSLLSRRNAISGDIFISIDSVTSNASHFKVSFENELHRVMIHGVLHLLGFNDHSASEKTIMSSQEDKSLLLLNEN